MNPLISPVDRARQAMNSRFFAQAEEVARQAVQQDADDLRAWDVLGDALRA
jgi:hypothetical protein